MDDTELDTRLRETIGRAGFPEHKRANAKSALMERIEFYEASGERSERMLENSILVATRRHRTRMRPVIAGAAGVGVVALTIFAVLHAQLPKAHKQSLANTAKTNKSIPASSVNNVTAIKLTSQRDGWAIQNTGGTVRLLRTTDGGHSWVDVTPKSKHLGGFPVADLNPTQQNAFATCFPDSNHAVLAWSVPEGVQGNKRLADNIFIEYTNNAGKTWGVAKVPDSQSTLLGQQPVSLDFINPKDGWLTVAPKTGAGGLYTRGSLYKTTDGGASWSVVATVNPSNSHSLPATSADVNDAWVQFVTSEIGFTTGQASTQTDLMNSADTSLYRTSDAGHSWEKITLPGLVRAKIGRVIILHPEMVGHTLMLPVVTETSSPGKPITAQLHIYASSDNGQHFAQRKGQATYAQSASQPPSIQYGFWSINQGWFWINGRLYTTDNNGLSVSKVTSNRTFGTTHGRPVISWGTNSYAIVAAQGAVWETKDGGVHWAKMS